MHTACLYSCRLTPTQEALYNDVIRPGRCRPVMDTPVWKWLVAACLTVLECVSVSQRTRAREKVLLGTCFVSILTVYTIARGVHGWSTPDFYP